MIRCCCCFCFPAQLVELTRTGRWENGGEALGGATVSRSADAGVNSVKGRERATTQITDECNDFENDDGQQESEAAEK